MSVSGQHIPLTETALGENRTSSIHLGKTFVVDWVLNVENQAAAVHIVWLEKG